MNAAEGLRLARAVIDDLVVVELDARLNDERQHARPGRLEPGAREGLAMRSDRCGRGFRRRDGERREVLGRAARRRHFGADHVDRRFSACGSPARLCASAEIRRARGDDFFRQWIRVALAGHRAIEVNLANARGDVFADEIGRLRHRRPGRLCAPGIGPEVIAADPDAPGGKVEPRRDAAQEAHEVGRAHARVAAELVDLVRGRLDEQRLAGSRGLLHRARDDGRMRGAERPDARRLAALVARDDVEQGFHRRSSAAADSDCKARRRAASSDSAIPASFTGPGTTLSRSMEITAVSKGAPALMSGATMMALP